MFTVPPALMFTVPPAGKVSTKNVTLTNILALYTLSFIQMISANVLVQVIIFAKQEGE